MRTTKVLFGLFLLLCLTSSCENDSIQETESLYENQVEPRSVIDRDEIKETDV